jgi:hypothetical protein
MTDMQNYKNKLKKISIINTINNANFLRKKMYSGTSGIGVVSNNLESYIHIFNSYSYFESDHHAYKYKLTLNSGTEKITIDFLLNGLQSKIIRIKDYFNKSDITFVSFRLEHELPNKDFVPYCFVTLIKEGKASSTVHSSSFGNTNFIENSTFRTTYLFDIDLLSKVDLCLLTLYKYKKFSSNKYKIKLTDALDRKQVVSFEAIFKGEICSFNFKNYLSLLNSSRSYWIEISGPSHANPYLLVESKVLLHI